MKTWRMGKGRLVVLGGAVSCMTWLASAAPVHAIDSTFKLNITSTECVVDVVQDGGSQTVQPQDGCEAIVPSLLTNVQKEPEDSSRVALPFAGDPSPSPIVFRMPEEALARQQWLPFATTEQAAGTTQPGLRAMTAVAGGVSALTVAGFLAIDVVVFEFQYTVRIGRMARSLIARL
jgi:hypothetical protein